MIYTSSLSFAILILLQVDWSGMARVRREVIKGFAQIVKGLCMGMSAIYSLRGVYIIRTGNAVTCAESLLHIGGIFSKDSSETTGQSCQIYCQIVEQYMV